MIRTLASIFLLTLATQVQAAALIERHATIIAAQQASASGSLLAFVKNGLETEPDAAEDIIGAAVVASPGTLEEIVRTALRAGATPAQVAKQCQTSLTAAGIENLVTTALQEKADPEPIMRACLEAMPEGARYELVTSALRSVDATSYEAVIIAAYEAMQIHSLEAYNSFVASVLDAEMSLAGDDIFSLEIETELTQQLLDSTVGTVGESVPASPPEETLTGNGGPNSNLVEPPSSPS